VSPHHHVAIGCDSLLFFASIEPTWTRENAEPRQLTYCTSPDPIHHRDTCEESSKRKNLPPLSSNGSRPTTVLSNWDCTDRIQHFGSLFVTVGTIGLLPVRVSRWRWLSTCSVLLAVLSASKFRGTIGRTFAFCRFVNILRAVGIGACFTDQASRCSSDHGGVALTVLVVHHFANFCNCANRLRK
jgi:hypothetical protein